MSDRFIPIVDDLLSCLRGDNVKDRLGKISAELEGASNQVRDVASFKNLEVDVLGKQRIELVAEGRDTSAQARGVEGNVDSGNHDERSAATVFAGTACGVLFQGLQAGDRSSNRVLRTSQVVVNDLQELAGLFSDRGHVVADLCVAHTELVGAKSAHCVVRSTLRVALDQVVHGRTALEHDFQNLLEGENPCVGREGGVFAQRVSRVEGVIHKGVLRAEFLGLGVSQSRQSNLGELREVEDALGVAEDLIADAKFGRVRTNNGVDGEAQSLASVRIGLRPHRASG